MLTAFVAFGVGRCVRGEIGPRAVPCVCDPPADPRHMSARSATGL